MDERIADSIRTKARRNHSLLLRCVAEVSQKRVAELLGVSETLMSTMKTEQLERFGALIAACGLKLAPATDQTFDESYISALRTLAKRGLDQAAWREDEVGDGA